MRSLGPAACRAGARALRMQLNGETAAMMEHVKTRWKDVDYDTSRDIEWPIDSSLASRDSYVWYWTLGWLAIKIIIFALPLLMFNVVALLPGWLYARSLEVPASRCTGR